MLNIFHCQEISGFPKEDLITSLEGAGRQENKKCIWKPYNFKSDVGLLQREIAREGPNLHCRLLCHSSGFPKCLGQCFSQYIFLTTYIGIYWAEVAKKADCGPLEFCLIKLSVFN